MRRLLREFRVEIIAALLIVVGVFLLIEQIELRVVLLRLLLRIGSAIATVSTSSVQGLVNRVLSTRPSDLLGLTLIVLALLILARRVRWRLMHSEEWAGETCPQCGGPMHRSHRRPLDRLINWFVPVRRYRCKDPDCGWKGLRIKQAI